MTPEGRVFRGYFQSQFEHFVISVLFGRRTWAKLGTYNNKWPLFVHLSIVFQFLDDFANLCIDDDAQAPSK